jgi:hypothetical protein
MTMSKRDYEALAATIRKHVDGYHDPRDTVRGEAVEALARGLAATMTEGNPRFSPDRFLIACGVKP